MRADARSLLDRLGRSDFAYKEFADRFSDLELWPLFEALLKDPRLFRQEADEAAASEATGTPTIATARPASPTRNAFAGAPAPTPSALPSSAPTPTAAESLSDLFSRYEAQAQGKPQTRQQQDVRAMLRRLSDLDSRGEL